MTIVRGNLDVFWLVQMRLLLLCCCRRKYSTANHCLWGHPILFAFIACFLFVQGVRTTPSRETKVMHENWNSLSRMPRVQPATILANFFFCCNLAVVAPRPWKVLLVLNVHRAIKCFIHCSCSMQLYTS